MPRTSRQSATRLADKPVAKPPKPKAKATAKAAVKPADPKKAAAAQAPSIDQISVRAYEIWLSKGRPIGQDQKNWIEAEAQLTQME